MNKDGFQSDRVQEMGQGVIHTYLQNFFGNIQAMYGKGKRHARLDWLDWTDSICSVRNSRTSDKCGRRTVNVLLGLQTEIQRV